MKNIHWIAATILTSSGGVIHAEDACAVIAAANSRTGSQGAQVTFKGYAFAKDTPMIYALGRHECKYLRSEPVEGQDYGVYEERYTADSGQTVATIWISKITGRVLREEQEGIIGGKGRGHISYHWPTS